MRSLFSLKTKERHHGIRRNCTSGKLDVMPGFCPVPDKIDRAISKKGTDRDGNETEAVFVRVQIQSGVGKLALGDDHRGGVPQVQSGLLDRDPMPSAIL